MVTQDLILALNKTVLPVVNINDINKCDGICDYLISNGYSAIEITFRTAAASSAIRYIKERYKLLVGAGTVLSVEQANEAIDSGADFVVAPGLNEEVVRYCQNRNTAVVPGIETASEIEKAMSLGLQFVKFFPAEAAGGVAKIKALQAPYKNIKLMPTGGITAENVLLYLSLESVVCCGGSYIVPKELL